MNSVVSTAANRAPALIAPSGERASYCFLEFFTANIRTPKRAAPTRARRKNSSIGLYQIP